jgi:type II secretory pathway pseudopilin PulG
MGGLAAGQWRPIPLHRRLSKNYEVLMVFTTKTQRHKIKQRTEDRGQILIRHPSSVIRRQGFTLIEIVVAIGLMIIMVLFTGSIFKAAIGSYRTAMAQAEIMRKLRVITQQLDSDFRGLRRDAPMFIRFEKDVNDNRFDQIMFFADGDFQATRVPVVGNVARIYYGQAQSIDHRDNVLRNPFELQSRDRLLARRQHILTADESILVANRWPDQSGFINSFGQSDPIVPYLLKNDTYEYDWLSLSQWQALANDTTIPLKVDQITNVCFDNRPVIKLNDPITLHNLMVEGVSNLSIQWSYLYAPWASYFWWPSIDPDGNGNRTDDDFGVIAGMGSNLFGFYFYSAVPAGWFAPAQATGFYYPGSLANPLPAIPLYPQALKFAFTLYDSRGVFKDGQTFTHIVYLGD